MALNYIWSGFFLVGFLAAVLQWLFLGDTDIFKRIIDGTFETARMGVMDIALPLAGVMTLWLGIMNIGEKAGIVGWLASIIMKTNPQMGLIANVLVGVAGSMLGFWIAGMLGIAASGGILRFVIALGGAMLLIFILGKLGIFRKT